MSDEVVERRIASLENEVRVGFRDLRGELRRGIAETGDELRQEISAARDDVRRHFDMVAERLEMRFLVVADGLITLRDHGAGTDQRMANVEGRGDSLDLRVTALENRAND